MEALYSDIKGGIKVTINNPKGMVVEGSVMVNNDAPSSGSPWEAKKKYFFFVGIPYAKPWDGEDQFLPPQRYDCCDNRLHQEIPFDAKKYTGETEYVCKYEKEGEKGKGLIRKKLNPLQELLKAYEVAGFFEIKNCFFLNVYTPRYETSVEIEPLPVLVYFHGSQFKDNGRFASIMPESMMLHDIVFVTVNYRVGAFGFLNLNDERCTGNAGLKDQVMALEWVRDNIEKFQGDPNNVTICGEGSGGTCVNFHLIAPRSRGLFHKAIIQSGGIYTPWNFGKRQRQLLKHYREENTFSKFRPEHIWRELNNAQVDSLLWYYKKESKKKPNLLESCIHIGPTYESIKDDSTFLPDDVLIEDLVRKAPPVPLLVGITEEEGNVIFERKEKMPLANHLKWVNNDDEFKMFVNGCLHWNEKITEDVYFKAIRKHYYKALEKESSEDLANKCLAKLCQDLWYYRFYESFKLGDGKLTKERPPMYVYKFNYTTSLNPSRKYLPPASGATFKDDVAYLYCSSKIRTKKAPFDEDILAKMETMSGLWASFCKNGFPRYPARSNTEWRPHTDEEPCYLHITNEGLEMVNGYLDKDWKFLNDITERKPNPPTKPKRLAEEVLNFLAKLCVQKRETNKDKDGGPASTSAPGQSVVTEQPGRSTTALLQVPESGDSKRHSPSKSPTSATKTAKDESSGPKKEKTA